MTNSDAPSNTVELPRGYIDEEGTHHREAYLRVPTLADEVDAEEDVAEKGYNRQNSTAFESAFVARCLVSLGEIPDPTLDHLLAMRRGEVAAMRERLDALERHDLEAARPEAEGNGSATDAPS